MTEKRKPSFSCDYMEGALPQILNRLLETNMIQSSGYGTDSITESAKEKIRTACGTPEADVFFLVGGTQTNATVIDALLHSYEGVVSAETGHVAVHEAGAIELGGHKVLPLPHTDGKLSSKTVEDYLKAFAADGNHDHMVQPGMVYISQPTEYGTLYTLAELEELSAVCRRYSLPLYVDGARLAYALGCKENDVTLADLGRLCDVFYIGGTKCGALFGEAVVIPKHNYIPHFFTIIKQHGALLAKGRIAGIQFDELFTDDLYLKAGMHGMAAAEKINTALRENGYETAFGSPTNQIFVVLDDAEKSRITSEIDLGFWENLPDGRTIMRIATSWATTKENVDRLIEVLEKH
ncbi:MAG: aminotransferase class V-fold PLP-dependent enzyme [Solobacterium sp.]|nr:aminotransferase class V-fold PLP-dependent enzyme [Solobacterium sp.]